MPFVSLYDAILTQVSGNINADTRGFSNTISGSWLKTATGSYYFLTSGSFFVSTGSFTGSISAILSYEPVNYSDTGSFSFSILNDSTASLLTVANPKSGLLSDSIIQGTCSINLGINY